jgi:hypothetical protein
VAELFDIDVAHPISDYISEQLLARVEQLQRVFAALLQMTE